MLLQHVSNLANQTAEESKENSVPKQEIELRVERIMA